jgi:DNA-binding transcriptional LysR family regulator
MGISNRAISQGIIQLEKSLGKKLIVRDTRFRGLTPFGKRYLAEMEPLLIKLEAVVDFLREMPSASEAVLAVNADADSA